MFLRARLKLAVAFAAALALILVATGTAAYLAVRRDLDHEIDSSLGQAASDLRAAGLEALVPDTSSGRGSGSSGRDGDDDDDHHDDDAARLISSEVFYVVTSVEGTILANPRQVDVAGVDFAALAHEAGHHDETHQVTTPGGDARFLSAEFDDSGDEFYLHVGRSLGPRDHQLRSLAAIFAVGGLAGVALSGVGGLWLAGRALSPIRRSLETQRQFLSDASHELRTPLAVVRANNELLLRHLDRPVEESLPQVEAIAAETDHMTRLVSDLLTLSRAEEGRLELVLAPLDLGALVGEVVRDMEALAELRGVRLHVDLGPATVAGSGQHLRQLVVILLDNALKYTPEGGEVRVECRRQGRRAELRVTDSGPGISRAQQRRIFDRFYREDTARTRQEGSGLGLAIASRLAAAHQGSIAVESEPGRGATFIVRLPLHA